jgi:hypothetical protein
MPVSSGQSQNYIRLVKTQQSGVGVEQKDLYILKGIGGVREPEPVQVRVERSERSHNESRELLNSVSEL